MDVFRKKLREKVLKEESDDEIPEWEDNMSDEGDDITGVISMKDLLEITNDKFDEEI